MHVLENGTVIQDGAFIDNGQGVGPVGQAFAGARFDPDLMRPYLYYNRSTGYRSPHVTINTGRMIRRDGPNGKSIHVPERKNVSLEDLARRGIYSPVANAVSLTPEAWIEFDDAVIRATRQRLQAWEDLVRRSRRGGFNAFARMTLEYRTMDDPGEAVVDMDGLAAGRRDRPLNKPRSVPLPITHSDFFFTQREIEVSQNGSIPLDTTMAEAAGRRVAETIEQTLIGTITGPEYGTRATGPDPHEGLSKVYGYTNFPYRVTKTDLTTPTGANFNSVVQDLIEMRETMYTNGFFGPFAVYYSTSYDQWMDADYAYTNGSNWAVTPSQTLRQRMASIGGIESFKRLDYLTSGYQLIMVQFDSSVVQAIDGMRPTTIQWETHGGMKKNFKVMAIAVPLLKAPYNGVAGIVHGTTS